MVTVELYFRPEKKGPLSVSARITDGYAVSNAHIPKLEEAAKSCVLYSSRGKEVLRDLHSAKSPVNTDPATRAFFKE